MFVSTRLLDRIYAIADNNGKREVKTILTGLHWPNGIALHNGTLYIAELNKVSKIDNVESPLGEAAPAAAWRYSLQSAGNAMAGGPRGSQ